MARAAAVSPVLFYLLFLNTDRKIAFRASLASFAFSVAVAVSRFITHAHSVSEAVSGFVLGTIGAVAFLRMLQQRPVVPAPRLARVLGFLLLVPLTLPQ